MIKIETERSIYFFDGVSKYCRMPRKEEPRLPFEINEQQLSGGPMDDGVWNEYVSVSLSKYPGTNELCLNIKYPGASIGIITTPILGSSMEEAIDAFS